MAREAETTAGRGAHCRARGRSWASVGFVVMTGLSLAILAAVVLLPAYGKLAEAEFEMGCLRADVAEAEDWLATNERLIQDLPSDEVLARRLARSQSEWLPPEEIVVIDPVRHAAGPPQLVSVPPHPRPAKPAGLAIRLAKSLQTPSVRYGLLLVAAGAMLGGTLLFPPQLQGRLDDRRAAAQ